MSYLPHFGSACRLSAAIAACMMVGLPAWALSIKTTTAEGNTVEVTAISDNIIKVSNIKPGQATIESILPTAANPVDAASYQLSADGNTQAIATASGIVAILDGAGQVTISGGDAATVVADKGVRTTADGIQTLTLYTTAEGSYYGAGERGHKLNLRGDTLTMYNRQNYGYTKGDPRINQMNITMPLVVSTDGFALLFDDFAAAKLYLSDGAEISYMTESPAAVSYYYIKGDKTIASVTEQLTSITGRQPLPPLWSLGYITSKYGYFNEKETVGAIDSLKTRGYPVDGIVLDLYWYGKEEDMGRLAWEPEQWPDAEAMLAKLKKENVNLIAISQPYVLRNGKAIDNYNYLAPRGMFVADSTGTQPQEVVIWVGEGGMFDVSNPDTQKWLRDRYKQLTDMGVTGWWGDLGEPEVHPETGLHKNGLPARLYHNKYGNDWSKIIADLFAEEYPDTRLVTMMRGGTTGLQKYSVFPWSTDVSRSWEGMQPQVTIMLNSGLSGLGYMGHDVGGFAVDKENPEDAELYVRWLQLGLFSPMLRTHAQYKAEPYHYEQYASIILPLIKERYRWLPYNYTLAYENAEHGYPLVRPLNFYEPGVTAYDSIDDEYLWGSEVLVAPVMQKGATERKVVFPQGTWIDYANPHIAYAGGSEITYPAPLSVLPLFVRAGAFIPMADNKMESTADYDPARLTIQCYPYKGVISSYTMFDDNRQTPQTLADGQYRLITFDGTTADDGTTEISISAQGDYTGAPATISMRMCINTLDAAPKAVTVDGKKVKTNYKNGILTFDIKYNPQHNTNIIIK